MMSIRGIQSAFLQSELSTPEVWFILIASLFIPRHIQPCCSRLDPWKTHIDFDCSAGSGFFKFQSKYTEVFSNSSDLPTLTLLFIYLFIWISCLLVEMSGAVCYLRPVWHESAWLRRAALGPGYLSWGLIMMPLSWSLRRLCLLRSFMGCWTWQVPSAARGRNAADSQPGWARVCLLRWPIGGVGAARGTLYRDAPVW